MKSREERIAEGLERGELVGRMGCGCIIIQDRTTDAYIVYCHIHASAPALYEALKGLAIAYNIDKESVIVNQDPTYWQNAFKALAKAEGYSKTGRKI